MRTTLQKRGSKFSKFKWMFVSFCNLIEEFNIFIFLTKYCIDQSALKCIVFVRMLFCVQFNRSHHKFIIESDSHKWQMFVFSSRIECFEENAQCDFLQSVLWSRVLFFECKSHLISKWISFKKRKKKFEKKRLFIRSVASSHFGNDN